MEPILILLVGGLSLTIGDLIAGKWVENKNKFLYILIMLFYMMGLNFLVMSYRFEDIAVASIILEIFNVTSLTLAGIYFFKENITKTELAGIIVGILAIIVLEL
jgi:multidrug transporter EmrE-like cation transporter